MTEQICHGIYHKSRFLNSYLDTCISEGSTNTV